MSRSINEVEDQNEEATVDTDAPVFDKEVAIKESTLFLKDLLLTDPQTQEELFVATNVQMNDDGSVSIVCVTDVNSDKAIMHTIFSGYVSKDGESSVEVKEDESAIISSPTSGKLVGLDGQPLT